MINSNGRKRQAAFTLVELLVVIGIIAILISVLLPSLAAARRSAQTVKCSAALAEIANCFKLYSVDNKGYYPPMWCKDNYQIFFPGNPPTMYTADKTYWMYFLAKYSTHANITSQGTNADGTAAAASILWGCPAYVPIQMTGTLSNNGIATVYTGYGMNGFPEYTPTFPPVTGNQYDLIGDSLQPGANAGLVATVDWGPGNDWGKYTGKWYKFSAWTNPAEKALVGDCRAYVLEAMKATSITAIAGQADLTSLPATFWCGAPDPGQTSYDFYRHGKYPPHNGVNANQFNKDGGKVGYNVMYADGHVVTLQTREEGFKAARMRWPG